MSPCSHLRPLLARLAEGDAEPHEALAIARHLPDCTACRILLAREVRLETALGLLQDPVSVNEGFLDNVMSSLPPVPARRRRRRLYLAGGGALVLVAAAAAAACQPLWPSDPRALGFSTLDALPLERFAELAGAAAVWFRLAAEGIGRLPALTLPSLHSLSPGIALAAGALSIGLVTLSALVISLTAGRLRPTAPPG